MIEVDFKDRVPTYPGQIKLTPVHGQPDTFTMERADEPIVEGTPINKATLDSIIHSRLTGRYYEPSVVRTQTGVESGITINPIPSSGWTFDNTRTIFIKEGYKITVSSTMGQADPDRAVDGDSSSYWSSKSEAAHTFTLQLDEAVMVKKIKLRYKAESAAFVTNAKFLGSVDGNTWRELWASNNNMQVKTEIALASPGVYSYYRLTFEYTSAMPVYLYDFEISEYDINYYHNEFYLADGLPGAFTKEQRLMLLVPENTVTMGVVTNSLNGILINTILQKNRRYELRYNGESFVAKEV